jgi:hypothetical protein
MGYDRKLSTNFMADLQSGILLPLLNRVREDETLMLAIRENYINIYYRGGSLYMITQSRDGASYTADFDKNYNKKPDPLPIEFPFILKDAEQVSALVSAIPEIKYRMDSSFIKNRKVSESGKPIKSGKLEREFQQLVVRENNYFSDSHYFIVDIEVAGILPNARYDMLAVRWINRKQPESLVLALIEMKHGINALGGVSGVAKHMQDAYKLRANEEDWRQLLVGLETQMNQLDQLGLLFFNRSTNFQRFEIDKVATPELIFLLAGHNPGSKSLTDILNDIDISGAKGNGFDLLFFASSFAGYRMYRESMLNLNEFMIEVSRLFKLASGVRKRKRELAPAEDRD